MPLPDRSAPRTLAWCVAAAAVHAVVAPAAAQLRTVNWNVARLNGDLQAMEAVLAETMDDDRPGFAVAPHVFLFQEVPSGDVGPLGALLDQAAPPGTSYQLATYTSASGEDGSGGAQALFYRTDVLVELAADHADLVTGAGRRTDRWHLELLGYGDPDARFWCYSSHLKAGTSGSDEAQRLSGAQTIRADVANRGDAAHVLVAGDLNLYSNAEPAYLELLAAGAGRLFDPLGTGSWNGPANAIKHTQSPRLSGGNLIGGGMDDRFDFQLGTAAMFDDAGLTLMEGTYRAMGNDGAHFDDRIDAGNNFYFPGEISRSNALAADLHDASDHLPLIADWMLPARLDASLPPQVGPVIAGGPLLLEVFVANDAPAVVADGAQPLIFSASGSGSVVGTANGIRQPLAPAAPVFLAVDTTNAGPISGLVTVTAIGQGTGNRTELLPVVGDVLRSARPSFDAGADVLELVAEITADEGAPVQPLEASLFNVGFDADQARLDLDAVDVPAGTPFAFEGELATDIGATRLVLPFTADPAGLAPGTYETVVTLDASDEDLPGETTTELLLTLRLVVDGGGGPDLDGDGTVGFGDLLVLLSAWGDCPGGGAPCPADLDGGGSVDFADVLILLSSWSG